MDKANEILSITESMGFMMIHASLKIKEKLKNSFQLEGFDITSDQFAVLVQLWVAEGLSQRDLCEKTKKTKSNLTRILNSMEKKGLIIKANSKEDRRSYNVFLTDKGQNIKKDLIAITIRTHEKIFGNLSPEEQELFLYIVRRIIENID